MSFNPNIHHRRSIRLKGYDYSQAGLYFITICCEDRICRFGNIVDGEMILNGYGQIAHDEWMKTPQLRPQIELNAFIVMPNHIHGILKINEIGRGELNSPAINMVVVETDICDTVQRNNTDVCATSLRSPSNNIGAIVRGYKSSVTKQINAMINVKNDVHNPCIKLWQRNYHEHIIRDKKSYRNIANYITNNPRKWGEDKFRI